MKCLNYKYKTRACIGSHWNPVNLMQEEFYQPGFWKIPLTSYISSVSFKEQNLTAKANDHYFHHALLKAADLIRCSLHYSFKVVLQIHESNQKATLGHCFLLTGELASDDRELSKVAGSSTSLSLFLHRRTWEARENTSTILKHR